MVGKFVETKCDCGAVTVVHYGICTIYEDKDGLFDFCEFVKCKGCGEIINDKRRKGKTTKEVGTAFY